MFTPDQFKVVQENWLEYSKAARAMNDAALALNKLIEDCVKSLARSNLFQYPAARVLNDTEGVTNLLLEQLLKAWARNGLPSTAEQLTGLVKVILERQVNGLSESEFHGKKRTRSHTVDPEPSPGGEPDGPGLIESRSVDPGPTPSTDAAAQEILRRYEHQPQVLELYREHRLKGFSLKTVAAKYNMSLDDARAWVKKLDNELGRDAS